MSAVADLQAPAAGLLPAALAERLTDEQRQALAEAGIEAGLHTVLVLTGIADDEEIRKYPFRPTEIIDSVADLV